MVEFCEFKKPTKKNNAEFIGYKLHPDIASLNIIEHLQTVYFNQFYSFEELITSSQINLFNHLNYLNEKYCVEFELEDGSIANKEILFYVNLSNLYALISENNGKIEFRELKTFRYFNVKGFNMPYLKLLSLDDKTITLWLNFGGTTFYLMKLRSWPLEIIDCIEIKDDSLLVVDGVLHKNLAILDARSTKNSNSEASIEIIYRIQDVENKDDYKIVEANLKLPLGDDVQFGISHYYIGKCLPIHAYYNNSINNGFYLMSKENFEGANLEKHENVKINAPNIEKLKYTWIQSKEDLTIYFQLIGKTRKEEIMIELNKLHFSLTIDSIRYHHKEKWFDNIISEDSFWTIENDIWLTIYIEKSNHGTKWSHVFEIDDGILEALDPNELALIKENLLKYTSNDKDDVKERVNQLRKSEEDEEDEKTEGAQYQFGYYQHGKIITSWLNTNGFEYIGKHLNKNQFLLKSGLDAILFNSILQPIDLLDGIGYIYSIRNSIKIFYYKDKVFIIDNENHLYVYEIDCKKETKFYNFKKLPVKHSVLGLNITFDKYCIILTESDILVLDITSK